MGYKYLYLVRHGQYEMDRDNTAYGSLVDLGHYQASCIANRLSEYPINVIHTSTMIRAKQTAIPIIEKFPGVPLLNHELLKEGLPFVPKALIKEKKLDKYSIKLDRERMETAYKTFFNPYLDDGAKHEAMICHGNIIRFFMCKALGVPIEAWTKFEIHQCSLSIVKVKPSGQCIVQSYAEIGHVPIVKRTLI